MWPKLKYPVKYLKSLLNSWDDTSTYDYLTSRGFSNDEVLLYLDKEVYKYPTSYAAYAGSLPEVVITPNKKQTNDVLLTTYYPVTSKYWATGHSRLDTPGGSTINVMSNDPDYNLLLNNCSDATREALEQATGKKINPWFFTTPGDVRSFAEDVLHGKSFDKGDGSVETWITLPQQQINKIAQYAQNLRTLRLLMVRKRAEKIQKFRIKQGPYKNMTYYDKK